MIKEKIYEVGKREEAEVVLAEIGGTVGDIESLPFLEAIRQVRKDLGKENTLFVHVTFVPEVGPWGEIKTKPTQHSVIKMREIGLSPDVLVCRTETDMPDDVKEKISMFCDVPTEAVIESRTANTIYEVPLMYEEAGFGELVVDRLGLEKRECRLAEWMSLVENLKNPTSEVTIGVIGKYTSNGDAYKSINEALVHGGIPASCKVNIEWIESSTLEAEDANPVEMLKDLDGVVIAPGFGERGIEGKIEAVKYLRESGTPFLGICLGLQMAVIEYARNVCGLEGASSEEFTADSPYNVIHYLPGQSDESEKGGTMRLGSCKCSLQPGTLAHLLYGDSKISDRHRHRYEVNNDYREILIEAGMVVSGVSPDYRLVEIVELTDHPFFIATQAHPEFKSRPNRPAPLFQGLVKAAMQRVAQKGKTV
jgi:CTP synthase